MNTLVKAFQGSDLRFVDHPENKYDFGIVAFDLAKALLSPLNAHDFSRSVDDDYKGASLMRTPGGEQKLLVLWEPGVYQVLARSRKQKAKHFQKWLFEEVLPSIRATGSYSVTKKTPELESTENKTAFAKNLVRLADLLNELDATNHRLKEIKFDEEPVPQLKYAGVVDIAVAQRLPVTAVNQSELEQHVKNRIGELAKTKEVYLDGEIISVCVYPDVSFMQEIVAGFFAENQ